ncbi:MULTISPECIES: MFS transporter [unclassified Beijerinckia]|uniref:MFS transporter n=1 Tax=unclassified Beijerinckia TaxID=2638183 RepID=UPI00089B17BA|nr:MULTISPECIES: MFS transporter [unclassified Beijerinckia]MDH7798252.1 MFS family permease [Beijerinckia sp. GAS462]SED14495.1 Sugar phosphate permease [Beijerinckia sp. 28-YEA-48]
MTDQVAAIPIVRDVSKERRLLVSCFFGSTLEWYDFLIYGLLAPSVFNVLFFPQLNPTVGMIAVFGIFAIGFIARPLGGIVFGHYGDRVGRKPAMIVTLIMMGIATTGMGLLPTYEMAGLWAPVALTVLRFLQGFALGGETVGGPLLAMESAPSEKRGLYAAIVQSGAASGFALGALVALLVNMLPQQDMLSWGWRLPFLASVILIGIGLYIRTKVDEAKDYRLAARQEQPKEAPLVAVLKYAKKPILIIFLLELAASSVPYLITVFGLAYGLQTLHVDRSVMLTGIIIGNVLGIATNPLGGYISDRVGRRPMLCVAYIACAIYVLFFFFPMLASGNSFLIAASMAVPAMVLQPMILSANGSFYGELFDDPRYRFTGASLGKQLGNVAGGGMIPMIAASIMAATGNIGFVSAYFCGLCVLGLFALSIAHETSHGALRRKSQP